LADIPAQGNRQDVHRIFKAILGVVSDMV